MPEWDKYRLLWRLKARPEQLTPPGEWLAFLILAGRGSGKTRAGAEDISDYCRTHPGSRIALVGPTFADVRDTMVEGDSGLLAVLPDAALRDGAREKAWNRSMGELFLANGCQLKAFASETPGRLRGPQHDRAWCDEPASFADAGRGDEIDSTWSNLMLGLRLGDDPRVIVTGTPTPCKLVKLLVGEPTTRVSRMTTYDNLSNLSPTFAEYVISRYEGTRLGRQELLAEILEDVQGAMWRWEMLDPFRVDEAPDLRRVVVGVDPAGSHRKESNETGIIVAGVDAEQRYYVLADRTIRGTPDEWARAVVAAFDSFEADRVVIERNYGGDMVRHTLATLRPNLPIHEVTASRGKTLRAEPIAALYEQARVSHVGKLELLEDQLTSWVPGQESPDRLDALVWALTELSGTRPMTVSMPKPGRIESRIV